MMESLNKAQMNVESLCPKPCDTLDYFGEESLDYKLCEDKVQYLHYANFLN